MNKIKRIMKTIHLSFATLLLIYLLLVATTNIALSHPILFAILIIPAINKE